MWSTRTFRLEMETAFLRFPRRRDFSQWAKVREQSRDHLVPWEPQWPVDANARSEWQRRRENWKRGWREGTAYRFLIFRRSDGALLGGIALTNIRHGSARAGTLGYWLAEQAQGQGVMTEAVGRICRFAREQLRLERVEAATVTDNQRSQNVLERCGFEREGLAKQYLQIAGTRRDHILYGKLLHAEMKGRDIE